MYREMLKIELPAVAVRSFTSRLTVNEADEKLSVRELEKIIRRIIEPNNRNSSSSKQELNPYYKEIKNQLQNYFGTKVNISNKNNKGKIEIEYYSEDDLQRILDIINI